MTCFRSLISLWFCSTLEKLEQQPPPLTSLSNLRPRDWSGPKLCSYLSCPSPLLSWGIAAEPKWNSNRYCSPNRVLRALFLMLIPIRELGQYWLHAFCCLKWPSGVLELTGSICALSPLKCVKAVGNVVKLPQLMCSDFPMKRE